MSVTGNLNVGSAVIIWAAILSGVAAAGPFEDGKVAAQNRDFQTAIRLWRPLAEEGNVKAQVEIAYLYNFGFGVHQDYNVAASWYLKAADQGSPAAEFALGFAYRWGRGVPKDYGLAAHWYSKAAEQGNTAAQDELGFAYLMGQGVPQDYVQAIKWLVLAAEHGERHAQLTLSMMYKTGAGVAQDLAESDKWRDKKSHLTALPQYPATNWSIVTQPVLICFAPTSSAVSLAIKTIIDKTIEFKKGEPIPLGCWKLNAGAHLVLAGEVSDKVIKFRYKCMGEGSCAPDEWTFYGPSETWFGKYLEPSDAPRSIPKD